MCVCVCVCVCVCSDISCDTTFQDWLAAELGIEPNEPILAVKWKHVQFAFCGAIVKLMPNVQNGKGNEIIGLIMQFS